MDQISEVVLPYIITALGGVIALQFNSLSKSIKEIGDSVSELNQSIGKIVTDQKWQKEQYEKLDERVFRLESSVKHKQ